MPTGASDDEEVERLISAVTHSRRLTSEQLRQVLEHVADAGFHPHALEQARGRLSGLTWRGVQLGGRSFLSPAEAHYLRHVVVGREWPHGTKLEQYLESLRDVVLDERSAVLLSRYAGAWQLAVMRASEALRGPAGHGWVLVEYRVGFGHWVTAYQPRSLTRVLLSPRREDKQWLRQRR